MNNNIYIIKLLLIYNIYIKYNRYIYNIITNKELQKILYCVEDFYKENKNDISSVDNLELLFYNSYPQLRNKDSSLYSTIFDRLRKSDPDPALVEKYLISSEKSVIAQELAIKAVEASEGEVDPNVLGEYVERLKTYSGGFEDHSDIFVTDNLNELLQNQVDKPGLNWSLDCLNRSLGPLRKGDFGFIFKRPETGGTTFLANQVSFMAAQVSAPILWINNEEQGEKVKLRCYQSALGVELGKLYKDRNISEELYQKLTGNKIKIPKDSSMENCSISKIEAILRKDEYSLLVIDQLDKVKGFTEDRKDLELGQIYKWARDIAKKYCPVIGVCQAAGTAENKMWLSMDDVAESKTSKQAEADWIIGIGCLNEIGKRNFRYFSICKNKLIGSTKTDSSIRHGQLTVLFKPEIARYEDIN